jgi:N-acetylglucosaminyldiphosphoundecaprenol N-acetyl-beta-D-mannosaminyltransferase
MNKLNLLSIPVSTGSYGDFVHRIINSAHAEKRSYACIANVHMLVEAHNDQSFAKVIHDADVITPDGKPLGWALRLLYGIKQERVAGMDLLPDLLIHASSNHLPVYFYGGTTSLLEKTSLFLRENYPDLQVAGLYSPPFRVLSCEEDENIIQEINASGARLVFVVLGCPKQERWMASVQGRLNAVTVGVGGALPVMIGVHNRAPVWMQKSGLEWIFRLMQEPKRLFKRYTITNSLFIYLLMKELIRSRVLR